MADSNYTDWSKDRLVSHIRGLEEQLKKQQTLSASPAPPPTAIKTTTTPLTAPKTTTPKPKDKKKKKTLDPSKYSTRLIALKLSYLGKNYGGFEYQTGAAIPSIEEELWKALVQSCLIWPEDRDKVDFAPWEYSKCGRTDRGVSAFGQVVGVRVRREGVEVAKPKWDSVADEINYPRLLNRLLPPDIRVLAWAPTLPEDFSARFSCWERQYRYFFTQPAFSPPSAVADTKGKEGWLDIGAMREAAKLFEGVHDFRNFCRVDGGKQISNFKRRVFEADVVEVEDVGSALPYLDQADFRPDGVEQGSKHPKVYYFHVRGSAFLWHQIRHMVAILFLVGQGLEKPSVITDLLDVAKHPRKPDYIMAEAVPLVLWDCIFPKVEDGMTREKAAQDVHNPDFVANANLQDGMDWVWLGEDKPEHLHGASGLADQLWEYWRERKMDELLANQLLDSVARKADLTRRLAASGAPEKGRPSQRVYEGGDTARAVGTYVPVFKKPQRPTPDEINDKWAQSKGFASSEAMAKTKNWRSVIRANKSGSASAVDSGADE